MVWGFLPGFLFLKFSGCTHYDVFPLVVFSDFERFSSNPGILAKAA